MTTVCSFVIHGSRNQKIFYTFNAEYTEKEQMLRPIYDELKKALNQYGDAVIRVPEALEEYVDKTFTNFNKIDCVPPQSSITFIVDCYSERIYTYKNTSIDTSIYDIDYYPGKIIMCTKLK